MAERLPRIALTPGDPAGIGPELCVALAQSDREADLVAVADARLLTERARLLDLPLVLDTYDAQAAAPRSSGSLAVLDISLAAAAHCGEPDSANARYVVDTIDRAARGCLDGEFDALVTGPVHKGVINRAGIRFTGHTEWLASLTGGDPVMMLTAPGLRVALVTTHLPLREVAAAITRERVERVVRTTARDLQRRFGVASPRLTVCGLNPHAGEEGYLGDEEIAVITPVLETLRAEGLAITGPWPADTAFTPAQLARCDAVVAMYHDQGLPVLKHAGFGRAVNVTLGLPIIRTSVDHGTAFDLAGTGRADPGSLEAALASAIEQCRHAAGS